MAVVAGRSTESLDSIDSGARNDARQMDISSWLAELRGRFLSLGRIEVAEHRHRINWEYRRSRAAQLGRTYRRSSQMRFLWPNCVLHVSGGLCVGALDREPALSELR
jgi:hypothetical protein